MPGLPPACRPPPPNYSSRRPPRPSPNYSSRRPLRTGGACGVTPLRACRVTPLRAGPCVPGPQRRVGAGAGAMLEEAGEVLESVLKASCLPLSFLLFVPAVLLLLGPPPAAEAAHEFTVYRMQQYELGGQPYGEAGPAPPRRPGRCRGYWRRLRPTPAAPRRGGPGGVPGEAAGPGPGAAEPRCAAAA